MFEEGEARGEARVRIELRCFASDVWRLTHLFGESIDADKQLDTGKLSYLLVTEDDFAKASGVELLRIQFTQRFATRADASIVL